MENKEQISITEHHQKLNNSSQQSYLVIDNRNTANNKVESSNPRKNATVVLVFLCVWMYLIINYTWITGFISMIGFLAYILFPREAEIIQSTKKSKQKPLEKEKAKPITRDQINQRKTDFMNSIVPYFYNTFGVMLELDEKRLNSLKTNEGYFPIKIEGVISLEDKLFQNQIHTHEEMVDLGSNFSNGKDKLYVGSCAISFCSIEKGVNWGIMKFERKKPTLYFNKFDIM
jgi:hypothetical protein